MVLCDIRFLCVFDNSSVSTVLSHLQICILSGFYEVGVCELGELEGNFQFTIIFDLFIVCLLSFLGLDNKISHVGLSKLRIQYRFKASNL